MTVVDIIHLFPSMKKLFLTDFPLLLTNRNFVYFDNAATTQKPQCVIDAITSFYSKDNANIHRGFHSLSQAASNSYELARLRIKRFLGANNEHEIIFTAGTTASLNLLAHSLGKMLVTSGDNILTTQMEHHSNIIPWRTLCDVTGASLNVIPITASGDFVMRAVEDNLDSKTKIVAITHVSNVLGTQNPIKSICTMAQAHGAVTVIDGAQSAAHLTINIEDIGADFYACSAHKMYGPTGLGILCGRKSLLESMPPYQSGGGMVESVTDDNISWREIPAKFEAGTPHIAGAVGLSAAIDYLNKIGMDTIAAHEHALISYASEALATVEGLHILGNPKERTGVISFTMDCAHPHDIAQILDNEGVAIRSGHHCAQPLMQFYNIPATARISFGIYNTKQDIDILINALQQVRKVFA